MHSPVASALRLSSALTARSGRRGVLPVSVELPKHQQAWRGLSRRDWRRLLREVGASSFRPPASPTASARDHPASAAASTVRLLSASPISDDFLMEQEGRGRLRERLRRLLHLPAASVVQVWLGTLNIYTQVGLITLIGIIPKHGILLVEFANQKRDEGYLMREAIIYSAKVRLRPILMTTAALALAVVPLMIAAGAGEAARQAMGTVIFSGLVIGTLLTLFVVPMFNTLISSPERPQAKAHPSPAAPLAPAK